MAPPEKGPELLRLTIWGQPAGAGSKTAEVCTRKNERGVKVPIKDGDRYVLRYRHASKFTEPWMNVVEREAGIAWKGDPPLDGALWLECEFFECRPSTHYFDRKAGRVLRPDASAYPDATKTHDVDKMRRAISDSLTNAKVLADDKRIVGGFAWKDFAENIGENEPKAVIRVGRMAKQTVEDLGLVTPDPAGQFALTLA